MTSVMPFLFFLAKRKPLAELVERKSLRLWTKIKLLVKVKLGLPTNKTRNKEDLIVDKDISSLEHTRWRCQYHVVFAPKYRRLAIYGELKQDIGYILRKLCERKGIEIIEAEACPDHIHMLISIPPKLSVSQVMGYLKGKSSLMIFDRHANLKYKYGNRHFWARGYYVPYKIGKLQIQGFSEPTTPNKIKQSYHITQKAARSRPRAAFLRGKLGRRQDFSKK